MDQTYLNLKTILTAIWLSKVVLANPTISALINFVEVSLSARDYKQRKERYDIWKFLQSDELEDAKLPVIIEHRFLLEALWGTSDISTCARLRYEMQNSMQMGGCITKSTPTMTWLHWSPKPLGDDKISDDGSKGGVSGAIQCIWQMSVRQYHSSFDWGCWRALFKITAFRK